MGQSKAVEQAELTIPSIKRERVQLSIVGDSPLIVHRWAEKALRQMLAKQMKEARTAKAARDPWADYVDALYWLSPRPQGNVTPAQLDKGSFGFPTVGFKAAAVTAAADVDGMRKTDTRRRFHIDGDFAVIDGKPTMREDAVRLGMSGTDLRYRPEFKKWRTTLTITFNKDAISPAQIANLFNLAGFGVGVGEWRPERDGSYGRFHVE